MRMQIKARGMMMEVSARTAAKASLFMSLIMMWYLFTGRKVLRTWPLIVFTELSDEVDQENSFILPSLATGNQYQHHT